MSVFFIILYQFSDLSMGLESWRIYIVTEHYISLNDRQLQFRDKKNVVKLCTNITWEHVTRIESMHSHRMEGARQIVKRNARVASTVLQRPIVSTYPYQTSRINITMPPRAFAKKGSSPLHIVWSRYHHSGIDVRGTWLTNHFVPLVQYDAIDAGYPINVSDSPPDAIKSPGGRRSPAVACWASDHWVASSNPLRGKFRH